MKRDTTIRPAVLRQIEESPEQTIFLLTDFSGLGSLETVRKIMQYAVQEGLLTHISHGIYAKPCKSRFGEAPPSMEAIAMKIAERDRARIQPSGCAAANIIGISTQVPMVLSYLTTGSTRTVKIGKRAINFIHSAPRNFAYEGTTIPLVVQALKEIGLENISDMELTAISNYMTTRATDTETFHNDILLAPQWVKPVINPIINRISKNETLAAI